ncbi:MAG: BlaI/MecI/CopY family transcriptional regulator [Candidatus Kariarchaeaceae archaeon]|jgi:DNA-binding PadR family transcriptional regulator
MKTDDLKAKVLGALINEKKTVRQIMDDLNESSPKQYAYTTLATTLTRLDNEGVVTSTNISKHGRKQKLFTITKDAHKKEVTRMLRGLFIKFGPMGVRHLGEVLDTELDEKDVDSIKKKLEL